MAAEHEHHTITIYSYQKVWGYEKQVYRLGKVAIGTPISENDIMFFIVGIIFVSAFRAFIPVPLPSLATNGFYYIGIPMGLTMLLRYKSFDGKNPAIFAIDYLRYFCTDRVTQLEFFRKVQDDPIHIAVWQICYRHKLRLRTAKQRGQTRVS